MLNWPVLQFNEGNNKQNLNIELTVSRIYNLLKLFLGMNTDF